MKFAFIADIHFSRYAQDKIEDKTNLPERLHSIKNALYEVSQYCKDHKIGTIIIGGDTLHGKSIIYAIAQDLMFDFFEDNPDIEFWVIDGNHDLSGKAETAVSALRPLGNITGVNWIGHKKLSYRLPNEDMLLVPYSYKTPEIVKQNRARILVSHFGLDEGILNSGLSIVSDVSLKDLIGRYELVLLGHYHKPQEIIREDIKLYYAGSLIQLDWGEKGDEKRFLVVDTDTLNVQSIPITNYKKHIEIELTAENKDEMFELARQAKKDGNHVKVIMKEKVDLTSVAGEFNVVDKTERDITDRGISASMSKDDIIRRYLKIKEVPEDLAEEYFKAGIDIINSCEI